MADNSRKLKLPDRVVIRPAASEPKFDPERLSRDPSPPTAAELQKALVQLRSSLAKVENQIREYQDKAVKQLQAYEAKATRPMTDNLRRRVTYYADEMVYELQQKKKEIESSIGRTIAQLESIVDFNYGSEDNEVTRRKQDHRVSHPHISTGPTDEEFSGTPAERLARINDYFAQHPERTPYENAVTLLPDLPQWAGNASRLASRDMPPLPKKAPALWSKHKQPGDTPPAFIARHYGPWLGRGLTRPDVNRLDPQLYRALYNWLQRGNELPKGFQLPTLEETNDKWAERVRRGEASVSGDSSELARVASALRRREVSSSKKGR